MRKTEKREKQPFNSHDYSEGGFRSRDERKRAEEM
jgi:hypothetical protein